VRGANPLALPHHEPAAIVLNLFLWFHARGRTQFAGPKIAMIQYQNRVGTHHQCEENNK
jgi:hypothetical protein